MENTVIMHLVTVATLIAMAFVIIGTPWLIGVAFDCLLNITRTDRDHVITWTFGVMLLIMVGVFAFGIYCAYTDIFTYYTKPQ